MTKKYRQTNVYSKWLMLAVVIFCFTTTYAQTEFPQKPEPQQLVNDFAEVLNPDQRTQLEAKLSNFNSQTSTQIAIVTVNDLYGYDKADYAIKLAELWGIGQKGKNNGILILIKPKTDAEKGKTFIAVGYGLEGVVPDIVARQTIISKEFLPAFKVGDYFTGLDRGTDVLMKLTAGEFTADQYQAKSKKGTNAIFLIFIAFVIIIFSIGVRSRNNVHSIGTSTSFLQTLLMMSMMGGRNGGSWSDFSGGRGDFGGGSSGGGFGGFGGGSFGGGGAGGEW